jgi:hypothetical protein
MYETRLKQFDATKNKIYEIANRKFCKEEEKNRLHQQLQRI